MSPPEIPNLASLPLARRVVTGTNGMSKSEVLYDDTKGNTKVLPTGSRLQTVWFTDEVPADCSSETSEDPTGNQTFRAINDGSVCTMLWMPPGASSPMHQTKSIDYAVVLEGEIVIQLEKGSDCTLKTGDVIVQRETTHAWHNRHPTKWTKMFCVLIASKNSKSNP